MDFFLITAFFSQFSMNHCFLKLVSLYFADKFN